VGGWVNNKVNPSERSLRLIISEGNRGWMTEKNANIGDRYNYSLLAVSVSGFVYPGNSKK